MADNDNPMKRLQLEINRGPATKAAVKGNRTFYINQAQFLVFQRYCRFKGVTTSEVLDKLIGLYLEQIQSDMPPDDYPAAVPALGVKK